MTEIEYYEHRHGCGSGSVECGVLIDRTYPENTKVIVEIFRGWMGSGKKHMRLEGTLASISPPIWMAKFPEEDLYFDVYLFDKPLQTEWFHPNTSDVAIGLYAGNGCHCTQSFQLQMILNNMANSFFVHRVEQEFIIRLLNGLKFEKVSEQDFKNLQQFIVLNE